MAAIISVGRTVRAVLLETIRRRPLPHEELPPGTGDIEAIRDAIEGMVVRLDRMEEERDFYKELLDSPEARREITPPAAAGEDVSPKNVTP